MGVKPLDDARWFEPGPRLGEELARKRALLETRHAEVFNALPGADEAARELLGMMATNLPLHHPDSYQASGDRLLNQATGEEWDTARPRFHPLDMAGRLVPEDLCLLQEIEGRMVLTAAILCSPARWRLAEKLGLPLSAIHGPVPGYAETLGAPVDRFLATLRSERPVWRLNWGLSPDPALFQPAASAMPAALTPTDAGAKLWLRVERQTLRRLPGSDAIVFTIRTYVTRLDHAVATNTQAAALAAAIRAMPPAMRVYKQIESFAAPLLAWLDARSLAVPTD
jgi:hypothetical protein